MNEEAQTPDQQAQGHIVDVRRLPHYYPTHRHEPEFWERLGRAVATFGTLENALAKAIFALTATRRYATQSEAELAFGKWLPRLEHALHDPLGGLIDSFGKAVREHHAQAISDLEELLSDLREASSLRNQLCHGSWGLPDSQGASILLFVSRKMDVFETPVDLAFLDQAQRHTAELICSVVSTVTNLGLQFPGMSGPGQPVWNQ